MLRFLTSIGVVEHARFHLATILTRSLAGCSVKDGAQTLRMAVACDRGDLIQGHFGFTQQLHGQLPTSEESAALHEKDPILNRCPDYLALNRLPGAELVTFQKK